MVFVCMYFSHMSQFSNPALLDHVPIIVFKLPRSGSSWFTDTMNSHQSIFLSKEIVQGADLERFSGENVESHLISALQQPTGKIASSGTYLPSGRFVEDYLLHRTFKPFRDLKVVGFTLNPEHASKVDWNKIAQEVPHFKIVLLLRSNIIKSAVSGFTGKETKKLAGCGHSSNIRASTKTGTGTSTTANCVPVTSVQWDINALGNEASKWQHRYNVMEKTIQENSVLSTRVVQHVYYEELQEDQVGTLRRMFIKLGFTPKDAGQIAGQMEKSTNAGNNSWMKRSPEDLRDIFPDYNNIENAMIQGNCICLLEQLRCSAPKVFNKQCHEVWNNDSKKCDRL